MGVLDLLCSCTREVSRLDTHDIEAGYTPIIEVKHASPRTSASIPVPYAGHVVRHSTRRSTSASTLIDIDEKQPLATQISASSSVRSSIISIPSTRITIPTSLRTGGTASVRLSCDSTVLGPPPSYHSRRAASPSPSGETLSEHPVMARDWLARLERNANEEQHNDGLFPLRSMYERHVADASISHERRDDISLGTGDASILAEQAQHSGDDSLVIGSVHQAMSPARQLEPLPQLYHDLNELLDFEDWNPSQDPTRLL